MAPKKCKTLNQCKKQKKTVRSLTKKDLKNRGVFFNFLTKLKPEQRCNVVKYLSEEYLDYICEALYNTVYVNNNLSKNQIKKLKEDFLPCKKYIKIICDHTVSHDKKRKLFEQKGGFLLPILAKALPIISGLFSPLFGRNG